MRWRPLDTTKLALSRQPRYNPSIILATAEGCGTAEIMRHAGVSKPGVWH